MRLKKIAALLMAVCLMMSVSAPVFAGGKLADIGIYTGGKLHVVLEHQRAQGNGWSYDPDTKTLTLDGFHGDYIWFYPFSTKFNLVLNGNNTIELKENLFESENKHYYTRDGALSSYGDLTISGTGSLTVLGGIYVNGNITLSGGTVKTTGLEISDPVNDTHNEAYGNRNGIEVDGGGTLTVEEGLLDATADYMGIAINGEVNGFTKKFIINGGKVQAKSFTQAAVYFDNFEMTDGELVIERGGLFCETFSLAQGLTAIGGAGNAPASFPLIHRDGELQCDYSKFNESLAEGEEPLPDERASYVYISKTSAPDQPTTPDTPITPPERPTPPDNAGSGSSGSSYGGLSSGAAEKKEQKPKAYTAAQAQKDLKKAMKDGDGKVQLKNVAEIPFTALKVLKGENIVLQADQTEKGKIVFRMTLNPAKADAKVKAIQTGAKLEDKKAQEKFEKYFSNEMRFIQLNQKGSYGMEIKAAAKLDLKGMDTKNLYFYSYDAATNRYSRIQNPRYYVDRNGYLHFATTEGGTIIISEKPLARR